MISNSEKDSEDIFGHGTAIYNIYRTRLPEAHITCYKIQDGYEEADENCLIAALEKILHEQDYDIINVSLCTTCFSDRLYDICRQISDKGTVIVSAFDNDGAISYPAAYPFVIGVDSSDKCSNRNQIEYVHSDIVNVRANGNFQRLAWTNPDYILMGGNSFACAHVGVIIANLMQEGVVLPSLRTLEAMRATTAERTPAKAWPTAGMWAKLRRKAAMRVMMTMEGKTMPRVAMTPPSTPFRLEPKKVAVLTAMTPGVHWPMAK